MPERGECMLFTMWFAKRFPIGTVIDRIDSLHPNWRPIGSATPVTITNIVSTGKKLI